MTCRQACDIFGKLRQCGFFLFQQTRRLTGHSDGLVQLFLMSLSSFRQFSRLPFEATNCVTSIAVQSGLARDIQSQLFNASTKRCDCLMCLFFLILQRIALNLQTLQDCRRNRLFLAQWWQPLF